MRQTTIGGNPGSFGTSTKDRRESDVETERVNDFETAGFGI